MGRINAQTLLFLSCSLLLACKKNTSDSSNFFPQSSVQLSQFPLHDACLACDEVAVRQLLLAGVNVNEENMFRSTPLSYAVAKLNCEIAKLLLEHGAKTNCVVTTDGFVRSALANAIFHDDDLMISLLKRYGADINSKGLGGQTDAHRIYDFTAEMLEKLIKAGLDLGIRDLGGNTAFDYLAQAADLCGRERIDELGVVLEKYGLLPK
jgi:ankyrin repeat protein